MELVSSLYREVHSAYLVLTVFQWYHERMERPKTPSLTVSQGLQGGP